LHAFLCIYAVIMSYFLWTSADFFPVLQHTFPHTNTTLFLQTIVWIIHVCFDVTAVE